MKKVMLFLTFTGVLVSCSNDENPEAKTIVEEVTISNTETFNYNLGYFGVEEGATVQKHPENADLSEIIHDVVPGDFIYQYKAQANFQGKDYVEIWTGRGSDGASPGNTIEVVKITFNITE
ncbi:hypothetical protein [Salinimicrobium flavum]|uniref:Uncharacterized protein n=1 Tax=Salinimicrobium flavum TaxID=1737065 RepID=A0ABW5IW64_9FLAO